METLFRFHVVRPATAVGDDDFIALARSSKLQGELERARTSSSPRVAMRTVARAFVNRGALVDRLAGLRWGPELTAARKDLGGMDEPTAARAAIEVRFGRAIEDLAGDADLIGVDEKLADSVVALRVLSKDCGVRVSELTDGLRVIALVRDLAAGRAAAGGSVRRALGRMLMAPPTLFPIPPAKARRRRAATAIATAERAGGELDAAIAELMSLDARELVDDDGRAAIEPAEGHASDAPAVSGRVLALRADAVARLSPATREVLASRAIDATSVPLDRVVRGLERDAARVAVDPALRDAVRVIGTSLAPVDAMPQVPTAPHHSQRRRRRSGRTPVPILAVASSPTTGLAGIPPME